MRIYISLPITGYNLSERISLSLGVADKIIEKGHEVINPLLIGKAPDNLNEREQYAYYMGQDIAQLLLCDAVLFLSGHSASKGCCAEERIAQIYGLKRFYSIEDIEYERMDDNSQETD